MCVLCGEMVLHVHWTDQPIHDATYNNKTTIVAGETQRDRMRLRLRRVAVANKILGYYGLNLRDWSGSRYILANRGGMSEMCYDLGEMWAKAEKLAKRPLDPLDEGFLESLEAQAA